MRVGFTCGTYDLLHAGHILALKAAKDKCDWLIVGLQSDPTISRPGIKNKPVQEVGERLVQLQGCRYVDEIWMYSTERELLKFLRDMQPRIDVRFLGADWIGKEFTGYEIPMTCVFTPRSHQYSSSTLRKRIVEAELSKES